MKQFNLELFKSLHQEASMISADIYYNDGAANYDFEEYLISSYELLIKMLTLYEASKFSSVEFNEDYFPQIIEIEKEIDSIHSINHIKF